MSWIDALMVFCGYALHFLKKMGEPENAKMGWRMYAKKHRYNVMYCAVSSVAGYFIAAEINQLNALNAFCIGFMSNSIADTIGKRRIDKIAS